jgi:hypothetical protein
MIYFLRFFPLFLALISFNYTLYAQNSSYWNNISENNIKSPYERVIKPTKYKTFSLNIPNVVAVLRSAHLENEVTVNNSNVIISLPYPDGIFHNFRIMDSPIMEKDLADKFPEIKTYAGQDIDDPYTSVRFDLTPNGFHAMIFTLSDVIFIDPYAKGDNFYYISYFKKDFIPQNKEFYCTLLDKLHKTNKKSQSDFSFVPEGQLFTYRIAIAATGEYTSFYGGTVAGGLAAVVTSLNRVDGIYEKELSIRMILVANNNLIIYTNASTDPYSNNNGEAMLGENQTNLDKVIGTANYDIGHVFSTGGGGIAQLGCVCETGMKAQGVTGSPEPVGDPFDIDYVAHEMGHQYDANHTFNCITGSCGGGNRAAGSAFEPGSGSTIMAYAGICDAGDLQPHSDAYFHIKSLMEINNYSIGGGYGCAQITQTGNHNPVVTPITDGFTIPKSTPFSLTGTATDEDNDALTYCWEEYDLGPAGSPNSPSGTAPIFRSFTPVTSGTRIFPKISNLINNTQTIGEILPTYTRTLAFRLTVRDNKVGGGGTGYSQKLSYNVNATAGPFLVTSPNTAVIWNARVPQTVTWNVANTNIAPVNCANVNILLSLDGGITYPDTLKTNTPNDGSEVVTLPMIDTTTARIRVEAADNIFFDISNTNFSIRSVTGITNNNIELPKFQLLQNYPNPFNPTTMIKFSIPKMSNVTLNIYDVKGQLVVTLINNELRTEGNYSVEFDGSRLASGVYFYKLQSMNLVETRRMILLK